MVGVSAVVLSPSGAAPSGLPRVARLDPGSLRKPKFRCAPFSLSSLRSLTTVRLNATSFLGVIARSRSVGRGYFRCAPITHANLRYRFASTSHSFGRILPRSSVGLASLRSAQSASFLGTIAFALVIFKNLPTLLLEITGKALFF